MFNVGPAELMVIFVLALMVFGPKRLPEVSRQIGKGIREFRRATEEVRGEIENVLTMDDDAPEVVSSVDPSPNGSASASPNGSASEEAGSEPDPAPPERTD